MLANGIDWLFAPVRRLRALCVSPATSALKRFFFAFGEEP